MYSQHHQLRRRSQRQISRVFKEIKTTVIPIIMIGITIIQTIDEIAVYLEVDIITSSVRALDQVNSDRNGQIISSDTDRLLEIIITPFLVTTVLIIEVKIEDIVHTEVSHLEPHKCRTGITH